MQEWFPDSSVDVDTDFWCFRIRTEYDFYRWFAESEFWLALVKVVTVVTFILLGLLAILV